MEINHILEKAYYYNDLTDYEKDVLSEFNKLMGYIGHRSSFYYCNHTEGAGGCCIVKKDGVWASYIDEKGAFHGYREYSDVYDLVFDIFDELDYDSTCYCINNFPSKDEFEGKHRVK